MLKLLRTYYRFLLTNKALGVAFFALIIVSPLAEAILPYFYKLFVNAIPDLDYRHLLTLLLLYIFIHLVSRLIDSLARFVGDALSFDGAIKARLAVFEKIHLLDFAFHATKSSGSLISTIKRGDNAFFDLYHSIHYRIVGVSIHFIVMMAFFLNLDLNIFLISAVAFLFTLALTFFFVRANVKIRNRFNEQEDEISAVIVDNMVNFETVKLFAKEKWEKLRLRKKFKKWKEVLWQYGLSYRYLELGMAFISLGGVFVTLIFALKATVRGDFTAGDFVLIVGFTASFYPKLFDLVWGLRQIAKNYSDIEKYFSVLSLEIKVKDPKTPVLKTKIRGGVVFNHVSFAYGKREKTVLKNFDLNIRAGQSVALVGRSGAGKTTVVKLLMRFFDPTKGRILVDGTDIRNLRKKDLRSLMGVVPQEPVLFNNTIAYNIAYGHNLSRKREIDAAAKLAHIHRFIESLPRGYQTQVGERGIKLSGGQKQRIAIARMILANPELVIFDEATSQLDSESEKLIQDAFWKAVRDKTTIIIAHRLSTVRRADKIVVMEKGRIVEVGSHNALLGDKNGLYRHFWDLQTIE